MPLKYWVKCVLKNHILIASLNSEEKLTLKYQIYWLIYLFMENKNIFVLFLYHKVYVSYVHLFMLQ